MIEDNTFKPGVLFLMACSAKATFLFGLAWTAAAMARSRSAAFRHVLWSMAILGALALPLLQLFIPAWHSSALKNAAALVTPAPAAVTDASNQTLSAVVVNAVFAAPAQGRWELLIVSIWAVGVFIFSARIAFGLIGLRQISRESQLFGDKNWQRSATEIGLRLGIRRPLKLLQSVRANAMPVTWGALQPKILVPASAADWTEERRQSTLIHELAHIARLDWLFQIFGELVRALYWFHPFAWVAAKEMRRESERACDDRVLIAGAKPTEYMRQLLELARTLENSGNRWSSALAIARQTNLERRFEAMLHPSIHRGNLSRKAKGLLCVAALFVLVPVAALRLPAQDTVKFGGTISDPSGLPVPNATVALNNHKVGQVHMTTSNREGKYSFVGLPVGEYELRVMKEGFAELRARIMAGSPGNEGATEDFTLQVGDLNEEVNVIAPKEGIKEGVQGGATGGVSGGLKDGVSGGARGGVAPGVQSKAIRLRIGGDVQAAKIVNKVQPVYPDKARTAGIDGTVILHAVIGMDGAPLSLKVVNNQIEADLARAAVEAVSKWRYQPTLLNGEPIEVDTTIKVNFTLVKEGLK